MVAHPVFRAALLLSLLAGPAAVAVAEPPGTLVAVDVGADGGSDAVARAASTVAAAAGLAPAVPDLADALADRPRDDPSVAAAARELAAASTAYGGLDCAASTAAAGRAVLLLAAAEAGGAAVSSPLAQAYVYQLLCAHGAGDASLAQLAADRLRAVGADPPAGVPADVWARYPGTDATTNRLIVPVSITSMPAGAAVWIDHRAAGASPLVAHVAEGEHLVAAATREGGAAVPIDVAGGEPRTLSILLPATVDRWVAQRARVREWRHDGGPDGDAVAALAAEVGAAAVLVVRGGGLEAWAVAPGAATARQVSAGRLDEAARVGSELAAQLAVWREPSPALPAPAPPVAERHRPWWVYASLAGAVAVAAGVILAGELADDHQRIELHYP